MKKISVALQVISSRQDMIIMLFLCLSTVLNMAETGHSERK